MTEEHYEFYLDWFESFTKDYQQYNINDSLTIKYDHTHRVIANIDRLCSQLQISNKLKLVAKVVGLFHDLGRWEQIKSYSTFNDNPDFDHGNESRKLLESLNILENNSFAEQILFAVQNHNKAHLQDSDDFVATLLLQIIRDADKLDALNIVCEHIDKDKINPTIELELPESETISEIVWQSFIKKEIINYVDLQSVNDFRLLQIAWIFDINFRHTIDEIIKQNYINILIDDITDKKKSVLIYDKLNL